eukprot:886517_1
MAGSTAAFCTYPLDFIRARLTVQEGGGKSQYNGIFHGMKTVYNREGFLALYRGLWPTLVGVFPYIAIDFVIYEALKPYAPKRPHTNQPTSLGIVACGGTAGLVSQTLAFPLELIRRRLQVQGFIKSNYNYSGGILNAFKQTIKYEGISGLYRGMTVNYVKCVPTIGIGFLVYERMAEFLGLNAE